VQWSGEDGASGHPLMTAAAIREAAGNFDNCLAAMWPDAARRHITQENFQRFTAGLTPELRIMDLLDAQPEFTKSIWDYLDILVNDNRLAKGKEILATYKREFDATEKAYGVDRYVIAAIWGIESNYSTQIGNRPRHWPVSAAARPISAMNSSRRWRSSIAATSGWNSCTAPGPARSVRPSSCRPRSSAMPSMPMAMAAATSSTTPPI
jgi:membrane-bound lytic murein transglycosylase B